MRGASPGQLAIAYLAIPDKRFTFDEACAVTSVEHLLRDHEEGPDVSLREHYEDWCRADFSFSTRCRWV